MDTDGFEGRLDTARKRAGLDAPPPASSGDREPHPLSFAVRLGAEMIGSLAVACAIGWGLDRLLGTRPWLMIALLPVGVAAGVLNLLRASTPRGTKGGPGRGRGWGT